MKSFLFSFDDLPLVIENGFEACYITGDAEISYTRDGEWAIESIVFDGRRKIKRSIEEYMAAAAAGVFPKTWEEKNVELDRGTPIYSIIYDRLENEWRDQVDEAVQGQIEEDRISAADDYADRRRDALLGY
jgi:hypothetical protein